MNYGNFLRGDSGAYCVNDVYAAVSSEFIYQNGDILVKVDEKGVSAIQAKPPMDVMLFQRAYLQKHSNLQIYVSTDDKIFHSCFGYPKTDAIKRSVTFYPEKAVFVSEFETFRLKTTLFVPLHGMDVILTCDVENLTQSALNITVRPAFLPYINEASLAPWDKPEWYLETSARQYENSIAFVSKRYCAGGDERDRRVATCLVSGGEIQAVEIAYERLVGAFDICYPQEFGYSFTTKNIEGNFMRGYPSVYAVSEKAVVRSGQSVCFSHVLSMQSVENNGEFSIEEFKRSAIFLKERNRLEEINKVKGFYENLFSQYGVETGEKQFDGFVKSFLPLQMHWVANLDRGWPTGMRGTRDAANDYMAELYFDKDKCENILGLLTSCQRKDGWFPRQVSTKGKNGKHDLREYQDGGAFYLEYVCYFLNFTGNMDILQRKYGWLDSDDTSFLLEHVLTTFEYYLAPERIGVHGLVKIGGGDWLDAVNLAGISHRGESVTITCQIVLALELFAEIFQERELGGERFAALYAKREELKKALNERAYNEKGFYNSVFNDNGSWIFSDNDPDGQKRVYIPANSFAIFSGVADKARAKSAVTHIKSLKSEFGYRLFEPPFLSPIAGVGRIASGDMGCGLWENGAVYNHGSHGFLSRAFAFLGDGDSLYETVQFMLPYTHDVKISKCAPYAIVNCYQDLQMNKGRAGMAFLTGTTAYLMRAVYEFMFGIKPRINGVFFAPCLKKGNTDIRVKYTLRTHLLLVRYEGNNILGKVKRLTLNGEPVENVHLDFITKENYPFIKESELLAENKVVIELE